MKNLIGTAPSRVVKPVGNGCNRRRVSHVASKYNSSAMWQLEAAVRPRRRYRKSYRLLFEDESS